VQDHAAALSSLVGLAVKQGSLTRILQSLILIMGHQTESSRSTKTGEGASTTTTTTNLLELKPTEPIQIDKPVQMRTAVGTLMTFGKGDHGKLGHGNSTENKRVPTVVSALKEIPLLRIDSLSTHSVAISVDGVLYTWGNGDKHRLGHGTTAKEYGLKMLLLPFFCWCLMIPDTHLLLLFL
jgi:alpha-tubulin suppressor-like RCC1 family protein